MWSNGVSLAEHEDAMNLRDALTTPSAEVTDEAVWQGRRRIVAGLAALPALSLAGCAGDPRGA